MQSLTLFAEGTLVKPLLRALRLPARGLGLAVAAGAALLAGCSGADADAPDLACPRGLRPVWIDPADVRAASNAECVAPLPLDDGSPARSGLQVAFPKMARPAGARNSPERIELGRLLYFDPVLSGDNTVACASCHHPSFGFTDNRPVAKGVGGKLGGRSAPTVWNAAFYKEQFWDGRAKFLEDQAKGPIQNPVEMNEDPVKLLDELRAIPEYVRLFDAAFGGGGQAVTMDNIASAIATFERTLVSARSPFDRYAAGETSALSASARRGLDLFRSVSTRCFECHGMPTFANPDYKVLGVPSREDPKKIDPDTGRAQVTPGRAYEHAFKVPTLRNVAKTAPYMHNGVFATLDEVLDFYSKGGGLGHGYAVDNIDDKVRTFDLSADEKADLIGFLNALTDESLLPEVPARVPSGLPVPKGPL